MNLHEYVSKHWDMNISLKELIAINPQCKVDRHYKAHKSDDCFHGYCIYFKHPDANEFTTQVGIGEDGFTYNGDGGEDLPFEDTEDILNEVYLYGEWIKAKNKCLYKLEMKGE